MVSSTAGVAERYGPEYAPMLLPDPGNVDDLAARLRQWRSNMAEWEARVEVFGEQLRSYGWQDMARRMVALVSDSWPLTEPRQESR